MAEQTESSWTESRFRQRLVGASVVVALAVLLLPLWLDGSGIDSLRVQPAPETPDVEGMDQIEVPQPPGESGEPLENPPGSLFPDQTPIEAREPSSSDPMPADAEASSTQQLQSEVAAVAGTETDSPGREGSTQTQTDVDSDKAAGAASGDRDDADGGEGQSSAEPAGAEDKASADASSSGDSQTAQASSPDAKLPESSASGEFVVQLGSFSDEQNARSLADSVESSGFDVFVTPLFSEQGTVWRVRVGPYASRDLAGEATERLRQRIGRDGLVMTR
ncbi:MAG: SPOR domain-containing protein [Guyparkeria sp.]